MAGTHLHPKDVPGAIVSLDWAEPTGSWRWGGPEWTGRVPEYRGGGIVGLAVSAVDPVTTAKRWATVLGINAQVVEGPSTDPDGEAGATRSSITLDGGQTVRFIDCPSRRSEGIVEVTVALDEPPSRPGKRVHIGGVRFVLTSSAQEESG
jgi:hypothetical protein